MTHEFSDGSSRDIVGKGIGGEGMAIGVGNNIFAHFQFRTDSTKPATNGVPAPGFSVTIAEDWPLRIVFDQGLAEFEESGGEIDVASHLRL